ncbi:MAG: hypothetical protein K9J17_12195 [Flavobacteriales bacterium]|nr:hypothetical protein [Flavobacteriales bacterium]
MKSIRTLIHTTLFASCGWGLFSCSNKPATEPELTIASVHIEPIERVTKASIRGLYLVNDSVAWASGTGGTFLRMTDGMEWKSDTVAGFTHLDFRDVHGFDANTALLMAAGEEGRILRTEDGGISWTEVYTRLDSGIFLDGMDFRGNVGFCYGDPIDGKFVVLRSEDQGKTWKELDPSLMVPSQEKEAGFAASGTGIIAGNKVNFIATGGGATARIMTLEETKGRWTAYDTPLRSEDGCGIFSISKTKNGLVAVGGCYLDSTNSLANCAVSLDEGKTWNLISKDQPRGYRSCVAYSSEANLLIASGRTGMEYSITDGATWIPITDEGYYTCALANSTGWAMGKRGKMARLTWESTK